MEPLALPPAAAPGRRGVVLGALVALAGICAVLALAVIIAADRSAATRRDVTSVAGGLERAVEEAAVKLGAVDGFFRASDDVTPEEFTSFTNNLRFVEDPNSVAVALRVDDGEWSSFLDSFARFYPGAEPFELVDGEKVAVAAEGTRYILTYHRPSPGKDSLVGFDMGTEEGRLETIEAASTIDAVRVSDFLNLVDATTEPDGFILVEPVHGPDGGQIGVAVAAANISQMLGERVPTEMLDAMHLEVLGPGDDTELRSSWLQPAETAIAGVPGRGWRVVGQPREPYGSVLWVLVVGLGLAVGLGLGTGILTTSLERRRDLRAKLELAEAVGLERERSIESLSTFELLATYATDIIARQTPELVYLYASPAMEHLLGFKPDKVVGMEAWPHIHPEDVPAVRHLIQRLHEGADTGEVEHRSRHLDGHYVWFHTTCSAARDESGRLIEIRAASRDITSVVAQRQELEAARDTSERAARDKARFLATVSHEIRTPLNAISGMSELLADTDLDPEQKEYADTIGLAARSVVSMVGDLLDLSKAEVGRLRIEKAPFDLHATVNEVVRVLAPYGDEVVLHSEVDPDVPPCLIGDGDRIRQVLVNLVGNALKFTQQGAVTIEVTVTDNERDDLCLVRTVVTDTGIGIPSHRLEAIFDEFEQADDGTERRYGGTGLGLGISRQLINLMGGRIGVESVVGQGSTFWFELDLARTEAPAESNGPLCRLTGSPAARGEIAAMLSTGGWEVIDVVQDAAEDVLPHVVVGVSDQISEEDIIGALIVDEAPRRGNADKFRRAGAKGYLGVPTTAGELNDLLRLAISTGRFVTRHDLTGPVKRLRVLAADDAPSNRLLVERTLGRRGHSVVSAADGLAALAAFEQGEFDIVLLDGSMPGLTGAEVTRRIRLSDARLGRHTPIVALTGRVGEEERAEALAAGADIWIAKPFEAGRLHEVVERTGAIDSVPSGSVAASGVLDEEAFHQQIGGMPELAEELVASVRAEWNEMATEFAPERVMTDLDAAGRSGHRMRGVFSMLGGSEAAALAARVEDAARSGDRAAAVEAASLLPAAVERLDDALQAAVADLGQTLVSQPNR